MYLPNASSLDNPNKIKYKIESRIIKCLYSLGKLDEVNDRINRIFKTNSKLAEKLKIKYVNKKEMIYLNLCDIQVDSYINELNQAIKNKENDLHQIEILTQLGLLHFNILKLIPVYDNSISNETIIKKIKQGERYIDIAINKIEGVLKELIRENIFQLQFWNKSIITYKLKIAFLIKQQKYNEALEILDKINARCLAESINYDVSGVVNKPNTTKLIDLYNITKNHQSITLYYTLIKIYEDFYIYSWLIDGSKDFVNAIKFKKVYCSNDLLNKLSEEDNYIYSKKIDRIDRSIEEIKNELERRAKNTLKNYFIKKKKPKTDNEIENFLNNDYKRLINREIKKLEKRS